MTDGSQNHPAEQVGEATSVPAHSGATTGVVSAGNGSGRGGVGARRTEDGGPGEEQLSFRRRNMTLIFAAAALLAAFLVLPPLINVNSYQRQVTALMSRSLGRPVSLSSINLRVLPSPGFVLNDLSVGEDPAFGSEPVLSARTVVASIRIFSLWRGHIEISRLSVDDASLNLVRNDLGRWNLETLMLGAQPALTGQPGTNAAGGGPASRRTAVPVDFPYLEATNSRLNLKHGLEKYPFSVVNTDLSLWQDAPHQWRIRLRGQPFRTDIEMSLADTGQLRLEGSLGSAAQLRDMPLKLQVGWREAQLGELSRLLVGSDEGWRGDLTADLDVQGTLDMARTRARLRASGVRREEFAPESPLDFDATCNLVYQHSQTAVRDLDCDSALGGGRVHLKAQLPGTSASNAAIAAGRNEGSLELARVPVQAGLDLLRTIRAGFAPGVSARGSINGQLNYRQPLSGADPAPLPGVSQAVKAVGGAGRKGQPATPAPPELEGSLSVDSITLRGGQFKETLVLPATTLTPVAATSSLSMPGQRSAGRAGASGRNLPVRVAAPNGLFGRFLLPVQAAVAAGPAAAPVAPSAQPLALTLGVTTGGYDLALNGSGPVARLRDLAYAFGLEHNDALDAVSSGSADVALAASGPWLMPDTVVVPAETAILPLAPASTTARLSPAAGTGGSARRSSRVSNASPPAPEAAFPGDTLSGTIQVRRVEWRPAYLPQPVTLSQGTLVLTPATIAVSTEFMLGGATRNAVRGTAQAIIPNHCSGSDCRPRLRLNFPILDAAALQAALNGPPATKSLLSPILDRMRAGEPAKWPTAVATIHVDALTLGAVALHGVDARTELSAASPSRQLDLSALTANLLGGTAAGTARINLSGSQPSYSFDGTASALNPAQAGALLQCQWSGGPLSGSATLTLSGRTQKDLAASAQGHLKFDYQRGTVLNAPATPPAGTPTAASPASPGPAGEAPQGSAAVSSPEPAAAESEARSDQAPIRFDRWTGSVEIKDSTLILGDNTMVQGKRVSSLAATAPLGGPVRFSPRAAPGPAAPASPK